MERTNFRYLWIGLGIVALLALFALPAMGWYGYGYGPRPFIGAPGAWGFFGVGMFFRFLIWGAILFFVVNLFRRRRWYHRYDDDEYREPNQLPSDEILRRRFAAGEITREQYEEMRQVLQPKA